MKTLASRGDADAGRHWRGPARPRERAPHRKDWKG
jgi:hypothetical protein